MISLCVVFVSIQSIKAQLTSLGVIEDSLSTNANYRMICCDSKLYASSSCGLYVHDLKSSSMEWQKLPFTDNAVVDFEVRGDTIIAITSTMLYQSVDGGKTASGISVDVIDSDRNTLSIEKNFTAVVFHPSDAKRIHVSLKRGIAYTEDSGKSWNIVDSLKRVDDMEYNPLDEKNLIGYYNGTNAYHIYTSMDGGFNWSDIKGYEMPTRFVHCITFHPTDKNKVIISGDGVYAISEDQGRSWTIVGSEYPSPDMEILPYFYDLVYDTRNSSVLYGANDMFYKEKQIPILKSLDGGLSWETFYIIETKHPTGVCNMCIQNNILVIYTWNEGRIYLLDVDAVEASIVSTKIDRITSYSDLTGRKVAHPTRGIYIKDGKKVVIKSEE